MKNLLIHSDVMKNLFIHSDVMKNLSRALSTNLPPSHSIELLKTLGWKRDGGGTEPHEISACYHGQLKTFRWKLGRTTPAAHETGIKLEKQFYVLVVII